LAAVALVAALAVSAPSMVLARPAPESFADLAAQVSPAVVNISVARGPAHPVALGDGNAVPLEPEGPYREFMERFFGHGGPGAGPTNPGPGFGGPGPAPGAQALGSGFIVDPTGYVVTNNHVIQDAGTITVTLPDGSALPAELVGSDPRSDLALLKIEPEAALPFVSFGDSDELRPGDWVMTVGNPFGLGGTVTAGIVSARGRDLRGGSLVDFLQIDAAINQGNSGGPAFNGAGQVVGVNTAIYSPNGGNIGIGFAIPSNTAAQVIDDLRRYGEVKRGWLGVRIQAVTAAIAEGFALEAPRGALVSAVEPDSPAALAGLEAGDILLAWNGQEVAKVKDLSRFVAATAAGETVPVAVWRDGRETALTVTTGEMKTPRLATSSTSKSTAALEDAGLAVVELTAEHRRRLSLDESVEGVLVTEVATGGKAMRAGLRPGDVIRSVALTPVGSTAELLDKVAEGRAAGKSAVPLLITRGGAERFVSLDIGRA
jgi:serine protease Do